MTLKTKIALGFVAVLGLLLGVGGYALYALQQLDHAALAALHDTLRPAQPGGARAAPASYEAVVHMAAQGRQRLLALLAVSSLLLLAGAVVLAALAPRPLRKLLRAIQKADRQDFTGSIPAGKSGELGQVARAFNHVLGQLRDYRTSTVAQFRAERDRLASVVNALDEGLLVVDEHRRVIVANPMMSRLLGTPGAQLIGHSIAELAAHNELFAKLLSHLEVPATQRPAEAPVLALPQADGSEAHYHLLTREVQSINATTQRAEVVGEVLTLRDVSEYRRLDQVK